MQDPNPDIRGRGIWQLEDADVSIAFFDEDLKKEIKELNADFIEAQKGLQTQQKVKTELLPLVRRTIARLEQWQELGDRRWRWGDFAYEMRFMITERPRPKNFLT
jgi:ribosomal protein L29